MLRFWFFNFNFSGGSVLLLLRLEGSGANMAHCSLDVLGSSDLPTSASQSARITGMSHHAQLFPIFCLYLALFTQKYTFAAGHTGSCL